MLGTRASSGGSGTTTHRSSSGSNPDPSHAPSTASERVMKQSTDLELSAASAPDDGLQVATGGDIMNRSREKLAANVDIVSKDEGNSTEVSAEKTIAGSEVIEVKDGSGTTSKVATVSGALEHTATRTDQPKKKRKKADSTKNVQPNNADYGYNVPFDPAYYNPFISGYSWVTEPYMYGSMGMPYSGYPMGPYGVNSFNGMPPQAPAMPGYPASYQRPETQPTHHQGTEAVVSHSRQGKRPKDTRVQPQSSENNRQLSSHGSESRNRARSSSERRNHGRSDRASDDYHKDQSSRKRMRDSSPMYGDKHSSRRSRHSSSSRSMSREEDASDDERNFKRRWGRRSSVGVDTRH